MIFVTVGTHEQPFNRLICEIDQLVRLGKIKEEVIVQTGYTNYESSSIKVKKIIGYDEMDELYEKARIIITHGGPASIFQAWKYNKIPIVVPRNNKYKEHVDEHQLEFVKKISKTNNIIPIFDISDLEEQILKYNSEYNICLSSNSESFVKNLEVMVNSMYK